MPSPSWWRSRRPLPAADGFDKLQPDVRYWRQILPEQDPRRVGEPVSRSRDIDLMPRGLALSRLESVLGQHPLNPGRRGLGRVDDGHAVAGNLADQWLEQWIVGAAEDQRIGMVVENVPQRLTED